MPIRVQIALLLFPMTWVVTAGTGFAAILAVSPLSLRDPAVPAVLATAALAAAGVAAWSAAGRLTRSRTRPTLRVIAGGKDRSAAGGAERRRVGGVADMRFEPGKGWTS